MVFKILRFYAFRWIIDFPSTRGINVFVQLVPGFLNDFSWMGVLSFDTHVIDNAHVVIYSKIKQRACFSPRLRHDEVIKGIVL